jgi:hypothetical protein
MQEQRPLRNVCHTFCVEFCGHFFKSAIQQLLERRLPYSALCWLGVPSWLCRDGAGVLGGSESSRAPADHGRKERLSGKWELDGVDRSLPCCAVSWLLRVCPAATELRLLLPPCCLDLARLRSSWVRGPSPSLLSNCCPLALVGQVRKDRTVSYRRSL